MQFKPMLYKGNCSHIRKIAICKLHLRMSLKSILESTCPAALAPGNPRGHGTEVLWGHKQLDTTECLSAHTYIHTSTLSHSSYRIAPSIYCQLNRTKVFLSFSLLQSLTFFFFECFTAVDLPCYVYLFIFNFWPYPAACGIPVPRPGIKPAPTALGGRVLTMWLPGKFPFFFSFYF